MQVNRVNNTPSFKGIVSKGYLRHMQQEIKRLQKASATSELEEIAGLFDKMEKEADILDIEILPVKLKARDKGVKEIVPNETVVWTSSTAAPMLYRYNNRAPRALRGKIAANELDNCLNPHVPYKEILAHDGWATGVGYVTSKAKYPPVKKVLEEILWQAELIKQWLKNGTPMLEKEAEKADNLADKMQKKLSALLK